MSKKTLVIITVITIAVIGTAAWLWYQSRLEAPTGEVPDGSSYGVTVPVTPTAPTSVDTSQNSFPVATQSGGALPIKDFTVTARRLEGATPNFVLEENPGYTIEYAGVDQSFSISLTGRPFADARTKAEAAFLQQINLPRERACSLKVLVAIPRWVSDEASGVNYGLSWCPFAVPVPNN